MRCVSVLCCCWVLGGLAAAGSAPEPAEIELIPADPAPFGMRNFLVGITSLLGGWKYWHEDRYLLIQTVPADAQLGLYYIRSNFQKRYERAQAPVRLRLPGRANTTPRDVFTLRVGANGFTSEKRSYPVRELPSELLIRLGPLPNSLVFLGQTTIAGRASLVFHTTEQAQFRVSRSRGRSGFVLALTRTASLLDSSSLGPVGPVRGIDVSQLGEDILIRIETRDEELEVRSKQSYDPVRKAHLFTLDVVPKGERAPSAAQVRRALELRSYRPQDRCHQRAEAALRERLDPAAVARAFRPSGGILDLYRREAMLRLGRLDHGTVHTLAGETLRVGHPVEIELALRSAATIEGYLGLLTEFVRTQSEPRSVLRSLVAPGMGSGEFEGIYGALESIWESCR